MTSLTRDAGDYAAVSVARMTPILAAVASDERWDVQMVNAEKSENNSAVTLVTESSQDTSVSWTADGKVMTDKKYALHEVDPGTLAQSAFGNTPDVPEFQPNSCRDGRIVLARYSPEAKEISIWSKDSWG